MSIAEAPRGITSADPLAAIWRAVGSSSSRLVLTALLIVSLLLGGLLPQVPTALGTDRTVVERWVDSAAARYGSWGTALRTLGLFDIAHVLWFRLLMAALAWHLLVCAAHAVVEAVRSLGGSPRPTTPAATGHDAQAVLAPPLGDALRLARTRLSSSGLRVVSEGSDQGVATAARLYADRNRWGMFGPALAITGILLMLAGLLTNSIWGWRTGELRLAAGQQSDLGPKAEISVRLVDVPTAREQGSVELLSQEGPSATRSLGLARPACFAGICVYQADDGPSLRVSALDAGGQPLSLRAEGSDDEPELLLLFEQPQAERLFTIPVAGLAFRVLGVEARQSGPQATSLLLQAYRSGSSSPVLETMVDGPATVSLDEVSLQVVPQRYAVLNAGYLPGLPLLAVGAALLLLGISAGVVWPSLQVWVSLASERRTVMAHLRAVAGAATIDPSAEVERLAMLLGGDDVEIG